MEAIQKEFAIFIQQSILLQKYIDEDMMVCCYPIQHHKVWGFTCFFIQAGGHCYKLTS